MNAIQSGESTGTTEITPSGIEVYYQSQPKRLYRVRSPKRPDGSYNFDWREVPSVTTVLGVLDKPALPYWGMKVGIDGVLELYKRGWVWEDVRGLGRVLVGRLPEDEEEWLLDPDGYSGNWLIDPVTLESLIRALVLNKLTVNHVRDKAGNRGQAVHDAFEAWARTGLRPDASIFPEEERGYVEGLLAFLDDVPSIEPLACEVLVASVEYGFAGRYDIRFRTSEPHDVVVHRTPKKGPQYRRLAPGIFLGDLKTSRGAYPSHALQAEAYEAASIESGYEPTDARGILIVGADGTYQLKRVKACIDDFLAVLEVWRRMENAKEWL